MEERPFTERGNGPPAEAYRRSSCITRSRWSISAPCMLKSRHKEGFGKPNLIPTCSLVSGSVAAQRAVTRAPSASRLCSVIRFLFADIFSGFVPKSRGLQHFSDATHATLEMENSTRFEVTTELHGRSWSAPLPTDAHLRSFPLATTKCFHFQMCKVLLLVLLNALAVQYNNTTASADIRKGIYNTLELRIYHTINMNQPP
jgi:hypothetical protein